MSVFPQNYHDWKVCITERCGIPLTRDYVESRIKTLSNPASGERTKFIQQYGTEWLDQVVGYFKQALQEAS